jgi:hypothetical protein
MGRINHDDHLLPQKRKARTISPVNSGGLKPFMALARFIELTHNPV